MKKNKKMLDSAALIFPMLSYEKAKFFSFVVTLKDNLKIDVFNSCLEEFFIALSYFKSKLKKGAFWYYLGENTKPLLCL